MKKITPIIALAGFGACVTPRASEITPPAKIANALEASITASEGALRIVEQLYPPMERYVHVLGSRKPGDQNAITALAVVNAEDAFTLVLRKIRRDYTAMPKHEREKVVVLLSQKLEQQNYPLSAINRAKHFLNCDLEAAFSHPR